jgi:hypothetical protein
VSDRYCLVRDPNGMQQVLCRRSNPPGTAWVWLGDVALDEVIVLTKEGAEQMALTVGGVIRRVSS